MQKEWGTEPTRKVAWPVCILGQRLLLPRSRALSGVDCLSRLRLSSGTPFGAGQEGAFVPACLPGRAASGFPFLLRVLPRPQAATWAQPGQTPVSPGPGHVGQEAGGPCVTSSCLLLCLTPEPVFFQIWVHLCGSSAP